MSKNKNGNEKVETSAPASTGVDSTPALSMLVVTLCCEPQSGQISITPVGNMSAEVLREMLHRAEMQVVSFIAVENARQAAQMKAE